MSSTLLKSAVDAAQPAVLQVITASRAKFLGLFGSWVADTDFARLEELFVAAAHARAGQFCASTPQEARDFEETYEASLDSLETLGYAFEIVGKAKAGVFVRSVAHQLIAGAFAVGGAVLQAGLGILLPGVGLLLGAGANAGIQHVVAAYL